VFVLWKLTTYRRAAGALDVSVSLRAVYKPASESTPDTYK